LWRREQFVFVVVIPAFKYLITASAYDMASRGQATAWLRANGAVNVFAQVWLLEPHHALAGEVVRALRREAAFVGKLFVIRIDLEADIGMWNVREPVFDFLSPI
jgi:hypothetical protein